MPFRCFRVTWRALNDTYRNTDGGKEIVEDIEARIAGDSLAPG